MDTAARAATADEMFALGGETARHTRPGAVIALVGGLGAGKTHWTKGFVAALRGDEPVTSPTFPLVHEYRSGNLPVFHFDFYRVESAGELIALGWDEYLDEGGIVIAEWADKFPEIMPPETLWLRFSVEPDGARRITRD